MITSIIQSAQKYWSDLFTNGYQLYTDTKTELGQAAPDAGKIAIGAAKYSVQQVENLWQTWGDLLSPAAPTIVLSVASTDTSGTDTFSVIPMPGLGKLVPDATGIALAALSGSGTGTLKAAEVGFDKIKVTADGLAGLKVGDVLFGLVYRTVANAKTRPLANVVVHVAS